MPRARAAALVLLLAGPTLAALFPAAAHATTLNYYHTRSTPLSWPWNLIEVIIIAVAIIGLVIFSLTPRGREMMRRRRRGIFDTDDIGMYPHMTASTPLPEVPGANDCPQCGLAVVPGMAKCPKCGWNLHNYYAPSPQGQNHDVDLADLAGLAAVSMAPVIAAAGAQAQPGVGRDAPAGPAEDVSLTPVAPPEDAVEVPAAPAESASALVGVVQHEIVINGVVAFKEGERVQIEAESPDPERPEYKYVVTSGTLNRKFRLSDLDIFI